jgi:hypothetical protein
LTWEWCRVFIRGCNLKNIINIELKIETVLHFGTLCLQLGHSLWDGETICFKTLLRTVYKVVWSSKTVVVYGIIHPHSRNSVFQLLLVWQKTKITNISALNHNFYYFLLVFVKTILTGSLSQL